MPYSGKESACQCRRHKRHEFDPLSQEDPLRRPWQHTPVFLPGESYGQRSLVGDSPWGHKESDSTEVTEHISWYSEDEREFFVVLSTERLFCSFPLILVGSVTCFYQQNAAEGVLYRV